MPSSCLRVFVVNLCYAGPLRHADDLRWGVERQINRKEFTTKTRRHKEGTKILNHEVLPDDTERVATQIVDAAFKVHSTLGPGLLESVYETCLVHELEKRDRAVRKQMTLPVLYDELHLDAGLRLDLLVEDRVIVELKAVDRLLPVFEAQVLTYLKLTGKRLGLLINFNVPRIKDGIKRFIV